MPGRPRGLTRTPKKKDELKWKTSIFCREFWKKKRFLKATFKTTMKKIDKSENLIRLPATQFLHQWPSVHQSTGLPCLKGRVISKRLLWTCFPFLASCKSQFRLNKPAPALHTNERTMEIPAFGELIHLTQSSSPLRCQTPCSARLPEQCTPESHTRCTCDASV